LQPKVKIENGKWKMEYYWVRFHVFF